MAESTEDPALGVKIFAIFLVFFCTIIGTYVVWLTQPSTHKALPSLVLNAQFSSISSIPPFILRTAQLEMTEQRQRLFSYMNCLGTFFASGLAHALTSHLVLRVTALPSLRWWHIPRLWLPAHPAGGCVRRCAFPAGGGGVERVEWPQGWIERVM
jgi:hypothetical protein